MFLDNAPLFQGGANVENIPGDGFESCKKRFKGRGRDRFVSCKEDVEENGEGSDGESEGKRVVFE